VIHAFYSAVLHITCPASSWIVSFTIGISRTAQNISLIATSDDSLSSLASVLLRTFRRISCRMVLRSRFSSRRWMMFEVFYCHTLSPLCSTGIAAISVVLLLRYISSVRRCDLTNSRFCRRLKDLFCNLPSRTGSGVSVDFRQSFRHCIAKPCSVWLASHAVSPCCSGRVLTSATSQYSIRL